MKPDHSNAVCTLFEGHYHYGVASLANSLYKQGYHGNIYAGYRGSLPNWARVAKVNELILGRGGRSLEVRNNLTLHFIPVDTEYHLTNYKPDFLLRMWDGPARDAQNLFYFDPDIVVAAPWSFFSEWVAYGIALCEDVNSPLSENHPRRAAWRRYYQNKGIELCFHYATYVNGGFIGLNLENREFLNLWKKMQEMMAPAIGGLRCSALKGTTPQHELSNPFSPFGKTDQDALNATTEVWKGKLSIVGKEAMALQAGQALIPHALGHPKPWNWNPLLQSLAGRPPRRVDYEYWKNANGVIVAQPSALIRERLVSLKLAALIGRFYKRR